MYLQTPCVIQQCYPSSLHFFLWMLILAEFFSWNRETQLEKNVTCTIYEKEHKAFTVTNKSRVVHLAIIQVSVETLKND